MAKKIPKGAILVPTDFSKDSESAVVFASRIALKMGVPLVLLHVVHDPGHTPGFYTRHQKKTKKLVRKLEEIAAEMLDAFADSMKKNCTDFSKIPKVFKLLVCGIPVTRINHVAERIEPLMVVMGSLGRTQLSEIMVGSKASQIVRVCRYPVTIVKSAAKRK